MSNEIIPFTDMERMALAIAKSGLFGLKTPEQALVMGLLAVAEGRPFATAARDYSVIQGRPSKTAEAMLRDFIAAGGKIEWHELSDSRADATFSHAQGGTVRIDWDLERAKKAGLGTKDMWAKYPRSMLRARCLSEGIRTVFPGATSGLYVPEEAAEIPERDITPKRPEPVPQSLEAPPVEVSDSLAEALLSALTDAPREDMGEIRRQIEAFPRGTEWRGRLAEAYKARAQALQAEAV